MARPDKYADLRIRICEIFHENCGRYGYRRIHAALKAKGITASEKVVSCCIKNGAIITRDNQGCTHLKHP